LARLGDRLRVVQRRDHNCVAIAVDGSREVDLVLARAPTGATLAELTSVLYDDGCDAADAAAFVADMHGSQVFVCELVPSKTGEEPLVTLTGTLRERGATGALARLTDVADEIAAIDGGGPGAPLERYDDLEGALARMCATPPERKTMLQVE